MSTLAQFKKEWDQVTKMKLFEIEVQDKRTQEIEYVIFDIEIRGKKFIATHESLSKEQENSDKISFVSIDIDPDFSIDENLQELYSACIDAIIGSEFFDLS